MEAKIFLQGITIEELAEALRPLVQTPAPVTQTEQDEFLTREQVCQLLSINKTSLWKRTKSGKLKSYGIGNRVLYKRSEVLAAVKPLNH